MTRDLRPMQQLVDAKLRKKSPEEAGWWYIPFFTQVRCKAIALRGAAAGSWRFEGGQ